jgi:hypothetical protein
MDDASAVEGLKCADLVDAMGRLHRHRCHILDLVSPTPGRVLFGPAVTISYFPSCRLRLILSATTSPSSSTRGGGEVTPFQANAPVVLSGVGVIPAGVVAMTADADRSVAA